MKCPRRIDTVCGYIWMEAGPVEGCMNVYTGELTDSPKGETLDLRNTQYHIFPGFADMHVHLRGLELSYKEDEYSGTRAALRAGITLLGDMPNTKPRLDTVEALQLKLKAIKEKALAPVKPYAAIPKDKDTLVKLSRYPIAGFKIYPGDLETRPNIIREASRIAKLIVLHPELPHADRIEAESLESRSVLRGCDIEAASVDYLASLIDGGQAHIHVTHASCPSTVKRAKEYGFTVDTTPHYLVYNYNQSLDNILFKVNTPLRSMLDSWKLVMMIKEGAIDVIASDHAPHALWEKADPLSAKPGIPWLELWPLLLLRTLVGGGLLSLEDFFRLTVWNPRKILGCSNYYQSIVVFDPTVRYRYTGGCYSKAIPWYHFMSELQGSPVCVYFGGSLVEL